VDKVNELVFKLNQMATELVFKLNQMATARRPKGGKSKSQPAIVAIHF